MPEVPDWRLEDFYDRLVEWLGAADPPAWLGERVIEWLPTLELDPRHGALPEAGFGGDQWIVRVPDAFTDGMQVVCSYTIDEQARVVRCNYVDWRDDPPEPGHLH